MDNSASEAQSAFLIDTQETHHSLRTWLNEAPFTLTLSSGFFGFFAHCGVLSALIEEGLTPASATGSSAGALVNGIWASGRSIEELKDALFELRREDFWDPAFGFGLLKGELFDGRLRQLLACDTFAETRVPLRVTAFNCARLKSRVFNQGELAPVIRASCTFPGLFHPVWIEGAPYIDGGVSDRPGWSGIDSHERVLYHHLLSRSRLRGVLGLTQVPQRSNTVGIVINQLPRCSPQNLSEGPAAFAAARETTLRTLDLRLPQRPEHGLAALRLDAFKRLN